MIRFLKQTIEAIKLSIISILVYLWSLPLLIIGGKSRRRNVPFKGEETKRNLNHYRLRKEQTTPDVVRILQNKLIDNGMLLDFTDSEVVSWSYSFVNSTREYRRKDNSDHETYLKTIHQADEFIRKKTPIDKLDSLLPINRHCSKCGVRVNLEMDLCKNCKIISI